MERIPVSLGDRSYDVLIESGLLDRAGEALLPLLRSRRLVVVTEENVWQAQGGRLQASLSRSGIACDSIVLPPGEGSKDWGTLAGLIDRLLAFEVERGEPIAAFGGGVIGDLAGFAAAILNRGTPFLQIPTSLLAQVDSSVGGKTAINVSAGKNLVGAFHQPLAVLIDPDCLATLPDRQLRAGYAEVVKYGLLGDADFYAWCEANAPALLAGDSQALRHAIAHSVRAKAAIVVEDERETGGRRALLNLGHTFGHALEAETGFSDRLLHGEAVAIGMALAFAFSAERGLCPATDAERVRTHLTQVGFGLVLPADGAALAAHMLHDKKRSAGRIPFILVRGIGEAFVDSDVDIGDVTAFLDRR